MPSDAVSWDRTDESDVDILGLKIDSVALAALAAAIGVAAPAVGARSPAKALAYFRTRAMKCQLNTNLSRAEMMTCHRGADAGPRWKGHGSCAVRSAL